MAKHCTSDSMLKALAAGDNQVWEEFMQTPLYHYALKKLKSSFDSEGEDLMQNALINLYQALNRYLNSGNLNIPLEALFRTIVKRQKASYVEKLSRRAQKATHISWEENSMDNWWFNEESEVEKLETRLDMNRRIPALRSALAAANIKAEDWEIIVRHHAYGESDKSIATYLNKPVNTVKSRRQRAMTRLKSKMIQTGNISAKEVPAS